MNEEEKQRIIKETLLHIKNWEDAVTVSNGTYQQRRVTNGSVVRDYSLLEIQLTDEQHPMRYEFGIAAMFEIHDAMANFGGKYDNYNDEEDFVKARARHARAAYTRWTNKMAGFAKVIKEEK